MKFFEQYKSTIGLSDKEKITKQVASAVKWIWKYFRKYRPEIFCASEEEYS